MGVNNLPRSLKILMIMNSTYRRKLKNLPSGLEVLFINGKK